MSTLFRPQQPNLPEKGAGCTMYEEITPDEAGELKEEALECLRNAKQFIVVTAVEPIDADRGEIQCQMLCNHGVLQSSVEQLIMDMIQGGNPTNHTTVQALREQGL